MQKYTNTVQNRGGAVVAGATVTVTKLNGDVPVIYSANGTSPYASNVLTTDANGAFSFYAEDGRYNIAISGNQLSTQTITDILLEDPQDGSSVVFSDVTADSIILDGVDLAGSTGSSSIGFIQSGTGAVARTLQAKNRDTVNAKDFGAVGDGVADDTEAILAAIATGKNVKLNAGTFLTSSIVITTPNGINLTGEGRYLTVLKLKNGLNDHVISIATGATNCTISSLTIDQNRANNTGGHGIRIGGVDGLRIKDVKIMECAGYGIGMQVGTNTDVLIDDFELVGINADGMDIKDFNLANEQITLSNGLIDDFGFTSTTAAGFDIRGPAIVSNIHVVCRNNLNTGFRTRVESVQGRAGEGNISNINVNLIDTTARGFVTEGATVDNLVVSNINVRGGTLGVISGTGCLFQNISGVGATSSESLSIVGSDNVINGLMIDGATRAVDFESTGPATGNIISNFNFKNVVGADAVRIQATCDNNSFMSGVIQSGKTIVDSASNTTMRSIRNWVTSSTVLSPSFAIDSIGAKIVTIPHGLSVTPNPQDISLTVRVPTGGVNDWRYQLVQIDGTPGATNVSARVAVTTASATVGATAFLTMQARAKNS
jgi:hypothetical protein